LANASLRLLEKEQGENSKSAAAMECEWGMKMWLKFYSMLPIRLFLEEPSFLQPMGTVIHLTVKHGEEVRKIDVTLDVTLKDGL
jgi:hypothetical protein